MNYLDYPFYYKDLLLGKLRNHIEPYIPYDLDISKINENLYISDISPIYDLRFLKETGITHILTTVLGIEPQFPNDFKYMTVNSRDTETEDLQQYFNKTSKYIDEAIKNNGKILVHCSYGISRSATIIIAYFIWKGYSFEKAYNLVKSKREIINPNESFMIQLKNFETECK